MVLLGTYVYTELLLSEATYYVVGIVLGPRKATG